MTDDCRMTDYVPRESERGGDPASAAADATPCYTVDERHHRHTSVTPPLHRRYTAVSRPSNHRYIAVASPLHSRDTVDELTVAEFIHLLLRCAKLWGGPKESLSTNFSTMMEQHVMPHAHKDPEAFLRDLLEDDQPVRPAACEVGCGPRRDRPATHVA